MSDNSGTSNGRSGATATTLAVRAGMAAGGMGCLASPVVLAVGITVVFVIGGLGVIFAPLVALILFFGGGGGRGGDTTDPGRIVQEVKGNGKGALDPGSVRADLFDPIEKAGKLCTDIGPVVIAAQIDQESGFQADKQGPAGGQGISQLPSDVFARLGEDDDGDGDVSALDPADSILAQGRFMCELAGQVRSLANANDPMQDVASLTLAAYDAGLDAVRQAGSVPRTNESQQYVLAIRAKFAQYAGVVSASPSTSPSR